MSTPSTPESGTPAAQPTAAQPTAAQPTVPLTHVAQPAAPGHSAAPGQPAAPAQPAAPYGQQAPAYGQQAPAYAQQQSYRAAAPVPAAPRGTTLAQTNTYAVLAILLAFIAPIAGVVFGHLGLSQIKRTGDAGRGLAVTGLVIGYAAIAFLIVFFVMYIGFIALAIGAMSDSYYGYGY